MTATTDWHTRAAALAHAAQDLIGAPASGAAASPKYNPRDGTLLYRLPDAGPDAVDQAVGRARAALEDGRWANISTAQRSMVLRELARLIDRDREELALLESLDVGKPVGEALRVDIPMAIAALHYAADTIGHVLGQAYSDAGNLTYQLFRPVGVVAAIVGWNFPLVLAAGKIGPALASGNSLILKPSELTSLSALRLAALAREAGFPDDVLQVVTGGAPVGDALGRHPGIDLVTFTGSTQTGKALMRAAGESNMKRLLLECGGKAANIVFDDCPSLDAVAAAVTARAFWNQGQVCTASSRLVVHADRKAELLERIAARIDAMAMGDPLDPGTEFGASISAAHCSKVMAYRDAGLAAGGRIVHERDFPAPVAGGFYLPIQVFNAVEAHHPIAQEEIFGPLLAVMSFRDEADAYRLANATVYGLSTIVWTTSAARAHRAARAIETGSISIHMSERMEGGPAPGVFPGGGHKQSGLGLEGGIEGMREYMTSTTVQTYV